jgi:hypothetical protein
MQWHMGGSCGGNGGEGCAVILIAGLLVCPPVALTAAIVRSASTPSTNKHGTEKPSTVEPANAAIKTDENRQESEKIAKETNQETLQLIQRTIQESLQKQVLSVALSKGENLIAVNPESERIASMQGDYRSLAVDGVDTVIEVGLTHISNYGPFGGGDSPKSLRMQAHVRLIGTSDNAELFSDDYVYMGERLTLSEWAANHGARLMHTLQVGYETLGTDIYNDILLLYPFPDRDAHQIQDGLPTYGLAPFFPPAPSKHPPDSLNTKDIDPQWWTTVDSLQPTLRWQSFPRVTDLAVAPEAMSRIKNVRYDLVIAQERNLMPVKVVYWSEGLVDTTHTIDTTLSRNTRYFWMVRARFEIDGHERVTEWSSVEPLERKAWRTFHSWERPVWFYPSWKWAYRFKTPK